MSDLLTLIEPRLTEELRRDVLAWRSHIHQHPELSFEEHETAAYIERELRAMGYDDVASPTPTSRVATLHGRKGPGRTIALRADIDALPVEEAEGLACHSVVPGVSHVCGTTPTRRCFSDRRSFFYPSRTKSKGR